MAKARWYLTESAVKSYVAQRRWPDDDEHRERAEKLLLDSCSRATFREKDAEGREVWRSPRRDGGMRWIVDPRPRPGGSLPAVIWVGQGAPPERLWKPQAESRVAVEVWFSGEEVERLQHEADKAGVPLARLIAKRALW